LNEKEVNFVFSANINYDGDRYKTIIDNMIDGFAYYQVVLDDKGNACDLIFIDVNHSFEITTGLKRDFIINKKITELYGYTKDLELDWIGIGAKAAFTGEPTIIEAYSPSVNRWFSYSVFSFEYGYFATIFHDITDSKVNEIKITENEENYRSVFSASQDAIFIVDPSTGNIMKANAAACTLYGYTAEEIIKLNRSDFVSDVESMLKNIQNNSNHLYIYHKRKDGTIFPTDTCISEAVYNGRPARMIVVRDISDHKLVEELKKEIERNLLSLNESKIYENLRTDFFANISHELRTPLNVILSSLQLVNLYLNNGEDAIDKYKLSKYTKIMKQNCYRLLRLVNNLIDITKIDSGYLELSLENKNIVAVVEDITLSVAEYIENKSVNLIFDTETEEKIMALDPDMVERIVLNLLSNSIKFTRPNDSIYVSLYEDEDRFIISVKDTGIGIPQDKLNVIFDRFRQVEQSLIRLREGSGIGLSLVKSLVELHGGTISVKSTLGVGSEFFISLPIRKIPEDEAACTQNSSIKHSHVEMIDIEFSDVYS
jgi:PAS domain S-box-containing protein